MNQYNSIDPYGNYDVRGLSPYEMAMKMASWNESLRSTLYKTNEDLSSVQSTISQHADAIGLRVLKEDYTGEIIASMIVLDPYAIGLIADNIDITGYVTFSDLSQSGKTSINGANIITGSILAEKLAVSQLSAISSNLGFVNAGYIYGVTIEGSSFLSSGYDSETGSTSNMTLDSGVLRILSGLESALLGARALNIANGGLLSTLTANSLVVSNSGQGSAATYGPSSITSNGPFNIPNLNVAYAATAGNANTVQGYPANAFLQMLLSHQRGSTVEITSTGMIIRTPSGTTLNFSAN